MGENIISSPVIIYVRLNPLNCVCLTKDPITNNKIPGIKKLSGLSSKSSQYMSLQVPTRIAIKLQTQPMANNKINRALQISQKECVCRRRDIKNLAKHLNV
jgi:hypothetical protein